MVLAAPPRQVSKASEKAASGPLADCRPELGRLDLGG
jgi:hypothetical protein